MLQCKADIHIEIPCLVIATTVFAESDKYHGHESLPASYPVTVVDQPLPLTSQTLHKHKLESLP